MNRAWLVVALLAGCAKQVPVDYTATPHLPAPRAGTYARVIGVPGDGAVLQAMGERPWQASLAGGAAGLALRLADSASSCEVTRWETREALWRAGYPYPVDQVRCWAVDTGQAPPIGVAEWVLAAGESHDIGLVRARGQRHDVWVGLSALPRADLGIIPRQAPIGYVLELPALVGSKVVASDPDGYLVEVDLDVAQGLALDTIGEWVVEVSDAAGEIARFPVYVGMAVPDGPLFDPAAPRVADVAALEALLRSVRGAYGVSPWSRDMLLDAAARSVLRREAEPAEALSRLGAGPDAQGWRCDGTTAADCLAQIVWDPRSRHALLAESNSMMGLAASLTEQGVSAALLVAEP